MKKVLLLVVLALAGLALAAYLFIIPRIQEAREQENENKEWGNIYNVLAQDEAKIWAPTTYDMLYGIGRRPVEPLPYSESEMSFGELMKTAYLLAKLGGEENIFRSIGLLIVVIQKSPADPNPYVMLYMAFGRAKIDSSAEERSLKRAFMLAYEDETSCFMFTPKDRRVLLAYLASEIQARRKQ